MIKRTRTNRVIWHHSLAHYSPAAVIDRWHRTRSEPFECIGYHYVIRLNGKIEDGRDVKYIGAHAHGLNGDSVGVCFEGDFRDYEPTVEQFNAACELYHGLCRLYSKSLGIDYHRAIDNPCPGPKFNRADFREIVKRHDPYIES